LQRRLHDSITHQKVVKPFKILFCCLKGQVTRFFASGFFHESASPKPLKITVGSHQIFLKSCGDIRKSRCATGINDTSGEFATGVVDTGSLFATGVVDTGSKFVTGVVYTAGKFSTDVHNTSGK
jgi:hypothetical protein